MTTVPLPPSPASRPTRILLVEDDKFLRKAAEVTLKRQGFDVLTAQDGEAGLELAREAMPDLVLLDLIMPKMQGFQVLGHLKADRKTASIPVIVMSNLGQDSDVQRAIDAGASAYVVKSNTALQSLVDTVREILAKAM